MKNIFKKLLATSIIFAPVTAYAQSQQTTLDGLTGFNFGPGCCMYQPAGLVNSDIFIGDGGRSLVHVTGLDAYYNTGIGLQNMRSLTTGKYNTGGGFETMDFLTTGNYNTGWGEANLIYKTTANGNNASGWKANIGIPLSSGGTGTGDYNNTHGYAAAINLDIGSYNDVSGAFAMGGPTPTGSYNTLHGASAGISLTTGSYNTLEGQNAGIGLTTGSYNTVLGCYGLSPIATETIVIATGDCKARIVADQNSIRFLDKTGGNYTFQIDDKGPFYPKSFTLSALPSMAQSATAYVTDCRNPAETAGNGTGCLATVNKNGIWTAVWSGVTVTN